jgi:NAD-dependent SIR2 family protein deacetylase
MLNYHGAKLVVDAHGKVHQVKCTICTKIEGKEKLLAPKLNSLWKHSLDTVVIILVTCG